MSWRFVVVKSVLQAGHWKSLKTSIVTGAFLEPKALCGSTSGRPAEGCGAAAAKRATKTPSRPRRMDPARMRRRFTRPSPLLSAANRKPDRRRCYREPRTVGVKPVRKDHVHTEKGIPLP